MKMTRFALFCFAAAALVLTGSATAAERAVVVTYVSGKALVVKRGASTSGQLAVGDRFNEGSQIRTGPNSSVELLFDDGSVIRVSEDTTLRARALRRADDGATTSIFDLIAGRVKSAVRRLIGPSSKFEYHTKAAIAGVAGTPPFVVEHAPGRGVTMVDLLGAPGQSGEVYVNTDKGSATLTPRTTTMARFGAAPLDPTPIPDDRFANLTDADRFQSEAALNDAARGSTTTQDATDKMMQNKKPPADGSSSAPKGSGATGLAEKEMTSKVSTTVSSTPEELDQITTEDMQEVLTSEDLTESLADGQRGSLVEVEVQVTPSE